MRQVFAAILVMVFALACAGCKKPYIELQPMNEKLVQYGSMSIEVIPQTNDEDLRHFEDLLKERARSEHILAYREVGQSDLRMRVVIIDFEAGDAINSAYMTVDTDLLDVKRNIVVGRFKVQVKTKGSLTLDPEGRTSGMLLGVVNSIFTWLKDHRGE